ncbi:MAG: hypothetical protein E6I20_09120 [Chloroflexi bacterium]|nr:MAG: hypothetical protein E6I20_09120 [Chloroflexota bacterium]
MNSLVNDLLSVSRAERGTLRMETLPFDLSAVVRDVAQRYVAATEEEGRHRFSVDAPAELRYEGDPSRLEQLLLNLIGNAVKYSPSGGEVRVILEPRDGQALLTIGDDGIGILPEDLPRLGAPYVRGTGRAATFAGMGVGLYVAKLVAEAHRGSGGGEGHDGAGEAAAQLIAAGGGIRNPRALFRHCDAVERSGSSRSSRARTGTGFEPSSA